MLHLQKCAAPSLPITLAGVKEVRMEVVFGTPSQNCTGAGVCMIMNRLPTRQTLHCPHAPARISYSFDKLVFRFLKAEILRQDVLSRFDSPWFLVQESFVLPPSLVKRLGLPQNCVGAGLYPVEGRAHDWILTFSILPRA